MTTITKRSRNESVIRTNRDIPTLSQMIAESVVSRDKIKRFTKAALLEWLKQSERLNIARDYYGLRGDRWVDFASRLGVDRASAYQLAKLWHHRIAILKRCREEGHYPGWETCLYWHMRDPRRTWHRAPFTAHTDEFATPPEVFQQFGSECTLDACATKGKAMCADFIPKERDGLRTRWHGNVWMNPPYSNIDPWCAKAVQVARDGGKVIALLPVWSDAPWFHDHVQYGRVTFIRGKLGFVGRLGYAWFPSMIVEWNPKTVRRKAGDALLAMLDDKGMGRSGAYKISSRKA